MNQKHGRFDSSGFYSALDATRRARNLNWKEVAAQSGLSPSTLTRMAQGKRPDVDGLAALVSWSGLKTENFVRSHRQPGQQEPLAMISTYLRSDKNLKPEAAAALDEVIKATYEKFRAME